MKTHLLPVILALPGLLLVQPASVHGSAPPADSVHFCAFDDHERWRRDHPRPAAKPLANLNVGEPRTVRMIYFLPNDWPYRAEVVDSMKTVIKQSQAFYREQMEAHGYGDWTFGYETDAQGKPRVHRVDGRHPFSHYDNTLGTAVVAELEQTFDLDANIYFIVLGTDALRQGNGQPAGGVGRRRTKNGGALVVPDRFGFFTVAHELGHAFGLYHDFRDNRYIMSYGGQRGVLSACAAEFLAVHSYFSPAVPIAEGTPPTVEITSPTRYEAGSTSVPVRLRVRDSELHQVMLIGNAKPCRGLAGKTDAVVEYDYDGNYWEGGFSTLSDRSKHHLLIVAVDTEGNVSETNSFLTEFSPYEIAVLRGDAEHIGSVAFSPVGTILAAGPWSSGSFLLWDASSRERIGILEGAGGSWTIAFSLDGSLLASNRGSAITLWDVWKRKLIGTFQGHTDGVRSVAFSPDGSLLASGSFDRTVKLWDVPSRREIATLEGHAARINAVALSPDGALLASGSGDDSKGEVATARLWDVERRVEITTVGRTRGAVVDVAFSPDGNTLAWASWPDAQITLWDVESRKPIATFEGSTVEYSPDGFLLASFSGAITLWEAGTGRQIVTLPDPFHSTMLSFSSDGAMLAAGSWSSGTVTLWDVSEWTGPRPFALEIISGEGQQGAPAVVLAQPLVVEVRDQYGAPLPNASVAFTVRAGDGRLSGRFTVEHATTDADGRAELTLTLGPQPGPNIVGVSLGGHELAAFTAQGVGTPVAELEGDYRTWHLPRAATVRLGKGAMGEGDRAVALSADGRCLAVASAIGVWLYETAGSRAQALLPTEGRVHSVSFSLQGTLAAGLRGGRIELWEVETGERIGTLRHGGWGGLTVAFSPDGTRLGSRWRQEIKLWDVAAGRLDGTWEVPTDVHWYGAGQSVAFSPDGSTLVSGFQDGTVRLWEVANQTEVVTLEGHTHWVISVSFSPDGALLASAGGRDDRTVRLWDAATQAEIATLRGHIGEVSSVAFSSPDGATLASGSADGTVRLWNVATGGEMATLEEHGDGIRSVAFSRDGATLASAAADGTVLVREVATGNTRGLSGHASLSSMALSRDGVLASGYPDGTIRLWDVGGRKAIATLEGHTFGVGSVSFSSDGALLASGSWGTVKLWDVGTRQLVGNLQGHIGEVTSVSFSPDGSLLASAGGWDATVRLWDVATREETGILEGHTSRVRSVSFSSDGVLLASGGGEDKTVKLWDVGNRELIGTLEHEEAVYTVTFSPDGKTLASGSDGVRLWDVATRAPVATLSSRSWEGSVAFSPDGKSLVAGSRGSVELWDLETRTRTATLTGHTDRIHSVAITSDGATLASGAADGTMLLWNLQPQPRSLTKVPGRAPQGAAGTALAQPFVVLVLDQYGDPLAGVTVTFSVTAGGGTLSAGTATTDADGRAATTLTLGAQPGTNTVEAIVDRLEPVIFTATGVAMARTLNKPSGDEQEGEAGAALGEPFVVEVRDQNGNPLPGATATFAVTAGGGMLSATTATTGSDGRASTTLTLGRTPGTNTVRATVAGLEPVTFGATGLAVPRTLAKHTGDEQQAAAGAQLAEALVVSVRDQNGAALAGAVVTFAVLGDGGTLSATADTTDAEGLAVTTLTLGEELGTYRVEATVAGLGPVTFTASAEATPDFDGDGVTDFSDFFLFAEAFGGTDPRFDLDGSGTVDFTDFFLFAESFGQPARARLVAMARERIGLPDGPQLRQNAPNPFNSGTVLSWFQLQPGLARLEVFALTGQRVAVLHDGPKKAGPHRLRWDGRDGEGRPLASGVYLFRLVTGATVLTRKLTLLR